jgi:dienelactone hydrolase
MSSRAEIRIVVAAALASMLASAARANDAAVRGPFAVGFTSFVEPDGRELGVVFRKGQNGSPRPVPVFVFYPVDAADAVGAAPAQYPRNPFVNASTATFSSENFEAQGVDPAYAHPTPSAVAPFPLVVLDQGARAPYWLNLGLATRLASHGFVVALLAHYGEAAYASSAPTDPLTLGSNTALQRGLNRMYDIQLAIDRLLARSGTAGDLLHGLVDGGRIAAGGHSIGGLASLNVVAGDDDFCDTFPAAGPLPPCNAGVVVPAPFRDPRIRALVLLDPSVQLVHWHELHRVSIPAILIGEDADSIAANFPGLPGWLSAWAHQALSGKPSYLAQIVRSAHVPSLTSACGAALVRGDLAQFSTLRCDDPSLTPYQAANEVVWRYAIAFLKTELVGASGYQRMLTPGWAVANEPFATFFVNEKKNGQTPDAPFGDVSFVHAPQPNPEVDSPPFADAD